MNKNEEFYDYILWVIDDFEYTEMYKILIHINANYISFL